MRIPEPLLIAILAVVAVVVGCATVLTVNGDTVPAWFETLATVGLAGVLGAYRSSAPVAPPSSVSTPPAPPAP